MSKPMDIGVGIATSWSFFDDENFLCGDTGKTTPLGTNEMRVIRGRMIRNIELKEWGFSGSRFYLVLGVGCWVLIALTR